jgi:hypothetical protein
MQLDKQQTVDLALAQAKGYADYREAYNTAVSVANMVQRPVIIEKWDDDALFHIQEAFSEHDGLVLVRPGAPRF